MNSIFLFPLLLSLPIALLSAPVGAVLIWRRSSFLSDVIAHMGILAFAISELTSTPILFTAITASIATALLLEYAPQWLPKDAWLSSLSSTGIAIGILFLSLTNYQGGIEHVFWGDILTISSKELFIFYAVTGFLLMNLSIIWRSLMLVIFNPQMAALDGIPVRFITFMVNIIAGTAIALCFKAMGVLLTGALFTLPTIGIRQFHFAPGKQVVMTSAITLTAYLTTLFFAIYLDLAIAPVFVLSLLFINAALFIFKKTFDA